MIASIVKAWEAGKAELRHKWTEKMPDGYAELVLDVVSVLSSHMEEHDKPDPERITAIDHGDYQGTLVFVIGGCGYQPYTYYVVKVDYGSCSQCDSFQAALDGGETVSDLMTLALHVVQDIQVIKKAREHEAELLAARARIAKLEQEPPMAMIDFGVGVNWKGLSEDRQRLRAEVERMNGLLPLLMKLWDAAKEAAGTISMSQEHSCYHTYGFLDKEPALKMVDALDELRLWKKKETNQ